MGRRADGYHLLDSLMQPLELSDALYFLPGNGLSLEIRGADSLKADENNLVLRAARALQKRAGTQPGAHILLEKRIPMGAGLGGGSADAAAALRGLNKFWKLNLEEKTLYEIGLTLGADVPFCLLNAPARAEGIGERLTPIPCARIFPLVLIQPCAALSTKAVFEAYHQSPAQSSRVEEAMAALAAGDLERLAANARNALEIVATAMRPEMEQARQDLLTQGAGMARMTGSGSVVFGTFEEKQTARQAWMALREKYSVCLLTETAL